MSPGIRAIFLVSVLLWQALVWLTPWQQGQQRLDVDNAMAHAQALAHHHHDHGEMHVDDHHPGDGAQHHHASDSLQAVGLVPAAPHLFHRKPSSPWPEQVVAFAQVVPDGLLRPPQFLGA